MTNQDIFFSILTERSIQPRYTAERGLNPDMVTIHNPKGYKLYIHSKDNQIDISGYKVSKQYFKITLTNFDLDNISNIVSDLNNRF